MDVRVRDIGLTVVYKPGLGKRHLVEYVHPLQFGSYRQLAVFDLHCCLVLSLFMVSMVTRKGHGYQKNLEKIEMRTIQSLLPHHQ